jgi:transcriptional pleiotropic repressor
MSCNLLENTRKLNKVLQDAGPDGVMFSDLTNILSQILNCNVFVASKKGRIIGKEDMITDTKSEESNEDDKTDQADQIQNIIDSLSPMLNEEQKESMGMILKLAQLLTQSENDTETDSD